MNGEVYRFATPVTLERFVQSPTRWCGIVRDPVTAQRFQPTPATPWAFWIGGPYYFASDSTKAIFISDPHKYSVIRLM